jgi:hypothetical protein
MIDHVSASSAFPALRRALSVRRLRRLDVVVRAEIALLAVLVGGFVFWQVRVPLDGVARAAGPGAASLRLGAGLALLVVAAAVDAGVRHARRLREGFSGPDWLALPLDPRALERHLAWESSLPSWIATLPAAAALAAAAGVVPAWTIAFLAISVAIAIAATTALATHLAFALAPPADERRRGADGITACLASIRHDRRARRRPAARWRRSPAWLALWRKDLAVATAGSPAGERLPAPLLLGAASVLVWFVPGMAPPLERALAFSLALLAAGALADWLVTLSGSDPYAALRVLPLGVMPVWGARAASAAVALAGLLLAHGLAAHGVSPGGRAGMLAALGVATALVTMLGVNYGVTLFPRADIARRLLALSLGMAMAASWMLPLAGWVLLLTGVIHSARRLPRWARLEEVR